MATSRPFTWIASGIFALMAVLHIVRLFTGFQFILGSHPIPMWVSWIGFVIAAGLSWMLCREARGTKGA